MSLPAATFGRDWPDKFSQHQTMFMSVGNIASGGMSVGWSRDWKHLVIIPYPPLSCAAGLEAAAQFLSAACSIASHHVGIMLAASPEDACWAVRNDPYGGGMEGVRLMRVETLLAPGGLDDHDHPAVLFGDAFETPLYELCEELNIPLSNQYPADWPGAMR